VIILEQNSVLCCEVFFLFSLSWESRTGWR